MLHDIFVWWRRQMWSLAPERLRRAAAAPDATIVMVETLGEDAAPFAGTVLARRRGRETVIGPLGTALPTRRPGAIALRLPATAVLHREVTLPLAAERDLATVLGYEMDRLTPFDMGEVLWGVGGLQRDPAKGLRLTLIVVLRAPVERLLEALWRFGLKPGWLETRFGRVDLGRPGGTGRGLGRLLYGLCAALALLCLALPVLRQQAALDQAARQIAALAPARQEATRLRQRLAIAASGQEAVAAAHRNGDPLQILAALTAALPDRTSLSDLTLKSGDLAIDGQSDDAAGLIAKLSAAPPFVNPQFIAPVTRSSDGGAELFSIRVDVAP